MALALLDLKKRTVILRGILNIARLMKQEAEENGFTAAFSKAYNKFKGSLILKFILKSSFCRFRKKGKSYELDMSVIIPTYNRGELLKPLLERWREVHKVTRYRYEVIFSDDGSFDDSINILQSVEDLPLVILQNEHAGASKARNNAILHARGEKLLIMGDDIFPNPQIINQHYRKLKELPVCKAVLGDVKWHRDLKLNILMKHITEIGMEQFSFGCLKQNRYTDFRHFYTCNISIDRDFLLSEKHIFNETFNKYGFEDIELGYRLSKKGMSIYFFADAYAEHYHPYTDVEKFCKRQEFAGEMSLVFKKLHNEIEYLVQSDAIASCWKKYLETTESCAFDIKDVVCICQKAEDSGIRIREFEDMLSSVYSVVFRFFYEKGIAAAKNGIDEKGAGAVFFYKFLPAIISSLHGINAYVDTEEYKRIEMAYNSVFGVKLIVEAGNKEQLDHFKVLWGGLSDNIGFALAGERQDCKNYFIYRPPNKYFISRTSIMQIVVYLALNPDTNRLILSRGLNERYDIGTVGFLEEIINTVQRDSNVQNKILRLFAETFLKTVPLDIQTDEQFFGGTPYRRRVSRYNPISLPKDRTKKTVFVFPAFLAVGGVERNTAEIIKALNGKYNFVIVTFENHKKAQGSLHSVFAEICTGVFDLWEIVERKNFHWALFMLKNIYNPDIIWICNGCPWLAEHTSQIREIFSSSAIVDQQVYDTEAGWVQLYKNMNKGLFEFNRFIAINSRIRDTFMRCGIAPENIDLIYSVLSTSKRESALKLSREEKCAKLELDPACKYFVFIGRLTAQKAPIDLLHFISKVVAGYGLQYKFIITGNGELYDDVIQYIDANGLRDSVIQFNFVENTLELSSISEAIIFTSLYEGLSIALLEALSVGTPGLSTNVGDTELIFERYGNGLCFEKTGDIDGYLKTFKEFISRYAELKDNAEMNKDNVAKDFSIDSIAGQYVKCFDKALSKVVK